jgi:hypothetical protein
MGLSASWQLACSLAISTFGAWGWYLFNFGIYDFGAGLRGAGSKACPWKKSLDGLDRFVPLCIILRVATLHYVWKYYSTKKQERKSVTKHPGVLLYFVVLAVPVLWILTQALQPGMRAIGDHTATLKDWPAACKVGRPYHGLLQTRFYALLTGHLVEATLAILTTRRVAKGAGPGWSRVGDLASTLVVPFFGSIFGPIDFIHNANLDGCPDTARAYAYLFIAIICALVKYGLRTHKKAAPSSAVVPGSPFFSNPVVAWYAVAVFQICALEILVSTGVELKGGPPLKVCSNGWKEFFFPRFKGAIYFCYAELVNMALWTYGSWQRVQEEGVSKQAAATVQVAPAGPDTKTADEKA